MLLCVIRFVFAAPAALHKANAAAATEGLVELCWISVNDPSAGSPTETLLRLLLPLSDKVHKTFHAECCHYSAVQIIYRITQSVGATGGVYKGQGRNQRKLMNCAY